MMRGKEAAASGWLRISRAAGCAGATVAAPAASANPHPYITYAPFVLLSAYQGGWDQGALDDDSVHDSSRLYFATEPVGSFLVRDPQDWLGLGALALSGVVASALFGRLQTGPDGGGRGGVRAVERRTNWRRAAACWSPSLKHSPVSIALLRGPRFPL